MKTIHVVGAIIVRDNRILATQRGYGDLEGGWEFPGGKVEEGETGEQAIAREILEELKAHIQVGDVLVTVEHDYETFHLSMPCYVCRFTDESFELTEHHAARWLSIDQIDDVDWLPADVQAVEAIKRSGLIG